ncbi:MAG: AAA family ATPase [Candidatus Aminicenantes bacterium]|nr:MAG: AAA family ATPase [Candidatus Aminicenantes bacterium]
MSKKTINYIKNSVTVGQPIIQIISYEEKRVEGHLKTLFQQLKRDQSFMYWDINNGLIKDNQIIKGTTDPIQALNYLIRENSNSAGFCVFRDLNSILRNNEAVVRKLREAYRRFKNTKMSIFLLSPDEFFADAMKKEIDVVLFELPDYDELADLFNRFLASMQKAGRRVELTADEKKNFIIGVQGLTLDEAYKALLKTFQGRSQITMDLINTIHEEKKQLILKEKVLEYHHHKFTLEDLGGLDNLKDWLRKRQRAFSKEARVYGLEQPRGFLAMGVSGCGKSLAAKITASLWNLPLFRLDMNLVYSGIAGSPELVFSRALKTMDSVAPAVLWIDEIESGISDKQADSASSRILGYFLTWMQEHDSEIFIAATANRIDLLPAELLRRGRFDQIFFIDLPTRIEREEIFSIHLKNKGNKLSHFNIPQLAQITKGWTGSEIEQVIISAMYEAFNEDRKLQEDDLLTIFGASVPLSVTMEEQIKRIRSWAHNRAVRASSEKEY